MVMGLMVQCGDGFDGAVWPCMSLFGHVKTLTLSAIVLTIASDL